MWLRRDGSSSIVTITLEDVHGESVSETIDNR